MYCCSINVTKQIRKQTQKAMMTTGRDTNTRAHTHQRTRRAERHRHTKGGGGTAKSQTPAHTETLHSLFHYTLVQRVHKLHPTYFSIPTAFAPHNRGVKKTLGLESVCVTWCTVT